MAAREELGGLSALQVHSGSLGGALVVPACWTSFHCHGLLPVLLLFLTSELQVVSFFPLPLKMQRNKISTVT